jgi:hypothetical protein
VRVTRRGLIGRLLLGLGIESLLGPLRSRAQDQPEPSSPTVRLSDAELDDLMAFAGLVVEGRSLSLVERAAFVGVVEARTDRGGDSIALYRATVRLLERLAGRRFSTLDVPARLELIARYRLGSSHVRPDDDFGPYADDMRRVRLAVLRMLIADYYSSSAGWAIVGYTTFPGICGNLERYTRAER